MAPKRKPNSTTKSAPRARLSRRAKENNITNEQENEVREAFELFALDNVEGFEDEKEGVLRTDDVRRCLVALGINVKASELPEIIETLDPSDEKYVTYEHFLAYVALVRYNNPQDDDEHHAEREAEVHEAYALFTNNHTGPITLRDLKRVAKILKEDVSDDVLKDMLCEANGEGKDGWRKGVSLEDFKSVMRRAGVFG
ncbi:hypothetical protein, variant [Verruconis gallopava]|uniref:Calmodulin n=1 Tax=Verruconis gallopava TaxID=253628 RepID=A0A0D1YSP0_9PEZI|nr:uncharacterized protein PV09_04971 [Verruconis gallopava]XP_016213517.1 hypothetical protein, variant [Verruconis gallopava]KIW03647.1 hypothetical protein PV09_04971 [Verruconis gallopava]KIW03648.1 hypothetical protein, variant [Verruconis gallopava]